MDGTSLHRIRILKEDLFNWIIILKKLCKHFFEVKKSQNFAVRPKL